MAVLAQTQPAAPPPAPQAAQKILAATINVYVFPTTGQNAAQQSTDEAACCTWAVQNTGSDPFALQKQSDPQKQQAQQATAQQIENFKKACSVCLEAKSYLVKY